MQTVRRTWTATIFLGTALLLSGCDKTVVVETKNGLIEGVDLGDANVFRGVPYAKPPVGELRWRAPAPMSAWQETLDATEFGPACWQDNSAGNSVFLSNMLSGSGMPAYGQWLITQVSGFAETEISEDCLTLNITRPTGAAISDQTLPVMFWIHGGGHQYGSAGDIYESPSLANQGVILVSINYRLGLYGFLAHPELAEEDANGSTGNYGTLDQIAALQWVQDNIERFGGDPSNVTIFGESAGGHSVGQLMASPLTRGLFHRAIAQSGSGFQQFQTTDQSLETTSGFEAGRRLANMMGVSGNQEIAALRKLDTDTLRNAAVSPELNATFHPQVDGYVLPEPTALTFARGKQADIPLMVGSNADEGSVLYYFGLSPVDGGPFVQPSDTKAWQTLLQTNFLDQAEDVALQYSVDEDGDVVANASMMMGDTWFGRHAYYMAERQQAIGAPAYLYFFERTPPAEGQTIGAGHAQELSPLFQSWLPFWPRNQRDDELEQEMQGYWTTFARNGNPNGADLPRWPEFDPLGARELAFGNERSYARNVLRKARYDAMRDQQNRRESAARSALEARELE